jgi:DNA repair protein RecO
MHLALGKRNLFVTQVQPESSFPGLRRDYGRLAAALALLELYAALLPAEEPFPEAFDLLRRSLEVLEVHEKPLVALIWSQLAWIDLAGFMPIWDQCATCGRPLAEAEAALSSESGGYLCAEHAGGAGDVRVARAEVLIGLARTAELDAPPPNLRYARECLQALLPFWRSVAETRLPANTGLASVEW